MFSTLLVVLVLGLLENSFAAPKTPVKIKSIPNYLKVLNEFKKLQSRKSKDEMKTITALGLVSGALQVQRSMDQNLSQMIADLLDNIDMTDTAKTMPKIDKIERTIERDEGAIRILGAALDLARKALTIDEYRTKMKRMSREYSAKRRQTKHTDSNETVRERLEKLKTSIISHMDMMKKMIKVKSKETVDYLEEKHGIQKAERKIKYLSSTTEMVPVSEPVVMPIFTESIELNLIDDVRRQDTNVEILSSEEESGVPPPIPPPIEIDIGPGSSEEEPAPPPGGALVGLIASLSGGEEGSDVGALVGALTGLVMNLFGPGGLDIPSLIGGGTALLAGLLAGDRNFGVVLGEYVGLAVDGFSGGGGAINNGQFFGNFLGTLIAELSADPEDDDEPPKPKIFLENFLNSLTRAKSKSGLEGPVDSSGGGSNSFGFIAHIVRTLVGGVTSFILNASLGSSGGSSHPPAPPIHAPWRK